MRITMFITPFLVKLVLVTMAFCLAHDAVADNEIYRWVDEDGVVHFGDQPNTSGESETIAIKSNTSTQTQTTSGIKPVASSPAQEPELSIAEKRRVERAEKRREAAERRETVSAACKQRRQIVAQLEPSPRVMVEKEDGTVERLADDERLEMLDEANTYIAKNCND